MLKPVAVQHRAGLRCSTQAMAGQLRVCIDACWTFLKLASVCDVTIIYTACGRGRIVGASCGGLAPAACTACAPEML